MLSKDLKERFLKVYGEIAEVSGFFDIIMAVLRDNDGRKQKTDCFPVAEILAEKMEKFRCDSHDLLCEFHEKQLI